MSAEKVQLQTKWGALLGSVDAHHSKILRVLQHDEAIQHQAYVVLGIPKRLGDGFDGSKYRRKRLPPPQTTPPTLSVVWYGPMAKFEDIGWFFSKCSEYLQCPQRCDRNVPYRNPQSLAGKDDNPPMTFQLQTTLSHSEFETLMQSADPSAALQIEASFPETEPPAAIRTQLYRQVIHHQKRALTFMLMRERGPMPSEGASEIWKAIYEEADNITRYVNVKSGEICDYHPDNVRGGILADAMGLGKSLSIISLLATDWPRHTKGLGTTLLVVPPSLIRTWEEELRRHTKLNTLSYWKHHGPKRSNMLENTISYDIVLTTYNVVALEWRDQNSRLKPLYSHHWRRIVLDEAHEIRSGATARAKAICALRGDLRWAVTGTPIQNRWEDLASLLKFLRVYPEHDTGSLKSILKPNPKSANIQGVITSICLRRPKNAIELPRRTDKIRKLVFGVEEAEHYNQMKNVVTSNLHREAGQSHLKTYSNILAKINSLRQICNLGVHYDTSFHERTGPQAQGATMQDLFDGMLSAGVAVCSNCDTEVVQDESSDLTKPTLTTCGELLCGSCSTRSGTSAVGIHRSCQFQASCKLFAVDVSGSWTASTHAPVSLLPVKMKALQGDILGLPVEEKSIVFSFWTSTLDLVCTALEEVGLSYTRIDGTMPAKERQRSITSFTDDPRTRIILISLRCGATGLTLTAANNVFLMEPQWNPMLEDQALDRVYRIGQTKEVTTIRYIVKGSLEESIRHQQARKRNLAEQAFALAKRNDDWIEISTIPA